MNSGFCYWQVSLLHHTDLPIPLSPTTCQSLDVALSRYPSAHRVSLFLGSRLHHCLAGSPTLTGRIEFVILRMDRSPPAAPHPVSRRRSCIWLQAGERMPGEDFHLSDQCARRRTGRELQLPIIEVTDLSHQSAKMSLRLWVICALGFLRLNRA